MAKKRGSGNGSIRRQPSGNWRGQIMDGYRDDGKRNIISFSGGTKAEVQDKIREYWNRREIAGDSYSKTTPFSTWAKVWYEDYKTQVAASTYSNYQYTLNILLNYFGEKELKEIKPLEISRFFDFLVKSKYSNSYITKCRAMLIQIFDSAEANEMILSNPARKAKTARVISYEEESTESKDAYTTQELEALDQYLPNNLDGHSIRLMLGTGIRTQELLAFCPADIAEDGSTVSVTKAIKMVNGDPQMGPPKSKRGRRVIPVPKKYQESARYLREHAMGEHIWASNRKSRLYDVGVFRKRYYRTLANVPGVRKLSPHCCRHTYISNLEKRGVPMELIARLVGHSKISTTDGYLHTDLQTLSASVAVLDDIC